MTTKWIWLGYLNSDDTGPIQVYPHDRKTIKIDPFRFGPMLTKFRVCQYWPYDTYKRPRSILKIILDEGSVRVHQPQPGRDVLIEPSSIETDETDNLTIGLQPTLTITWAKHKYIFGEIGPCTINARVSRQSFLKLYEVQNTVSTVGSPLSRLQDPSSVDRSAPSLLSAQP